MSGYTKLFSSIVTSTIWRETKEVKIVWITMLALADQYGVVEASIPGLADAARVSIDECKEAIKHLEGPDEYSRSKDFDGRRIEAIDGGWKLLNHAKYREKMSEDDRREKNRIYQQARRLRVSSSVSTCQQMSEHVSTVSTTEQKRIEHNIRKEEEGGGKPPKSQLGDHQLLIDLYVKAFERVHGEKYPFTPKDARAAKELLDGGNRTPQELATIAEAAMRLNGVHAYESSQASSLFGFNRTLPQIIVAVKKTRVAAGPNL
jgi:hypothetical protein